MPAIGVIGFGFVGGAIYRGFNLFFPVKAYDVDPRRCVNTFEDVCSCDVVFVCLPTPMLESTGRADLSILDSTFQRIKDAGFDKPVYIIKSTLPIGSTDTFREKFGLKIIHSPEFLTARTADIDFITCNRTILGGPKEITDQVRPIFEQRFPGQKIMQVSSTTSEAIKYVTNCFFAVKIMFWNEMYFGIKQQYDVDWDQVMEGIQADGRISHSHLQVPGHDGKFGYGGACFPKDINALIKQIEDKGFDPLMLKACWAQNLRVRPEADWRDIPSAIRKDQT